MIIVETEIDLTRYQNQEIDIQFPLIEQLFNAGENIFGGAYNGSSSDYFNEESVNTKTVKLPIEFGSLALGDDPEKYYFVYYDDRTSDYYKGKGQGKFARISTQKRHYDSNDRLREILYSNREDLGYCLAVSEQVNTRAYTEFYESDDKGLVRPNGHMEAKYKLAGPTNRDLIELLASRVDVSESQYNNSTGTVDAEFTNWRIG